METKRIFIAAELPENMILDLTKTVQCLWPGMNQGIRWVPREQMHLTLKFIGEYPLDKIPAVQAVCEKLTHNPAHMAVQVCGFGVFPNQQSPNVLWAGLQKAEALINLQVKLDKELELLGIPKEKRAFKPHLTLARIKQHFPAHQMKSLLAPLSDPKSAFVQETFVEKITLFESQLNREGAIYRKIAIFQLP
jgi:2'-5' RNA ligase